MNPNEKCSCPACIQLDPVTSDVAAQQLTHRQVIAGLRSATATASQPKFIERDGDIWTEMPNGTRIQLTKSDNPIRHDAWECPRCHRINAPHAQQCSCTGQET